MGNNWPARAHPRPHSDANRSWAPLGVPHPACIAPWAWIPPVLGALRGPLALGQHRHWPQTPGANPPRRDRPDGQSVSSVSIFAIRASARPVKKRMMAALQVSRTARPAVIRSYLGRTGTSGAHPGRFWGVLGVLLKVVKRVLHEILTGGQPEHRENRAPQLDKDLLRERADFG